MIEVFQPPCNHQLVSHLPGCNVLGIQSSVIKIKKSLSQCSFAQAVTVKHWFLTTWATNLLLWFLTTWTTNLLLWFLTTWTINSLLWKQIKCCSSPTDRACDTSLPGVPFKEACVVAEGNIALSQSCGNSLNVRLQRSQVTKVSGYKGLGLQRSQQHSCPTRVQELCESRGGRPGLSVLMSLTVSVDIKQHWTMLRHRLQFVPNMSTNIRGHEALHHHQLSQLAEPGGSSQTFLRNTSQWDGVLKPQLWHHHLPHTPPTPPYSPNPCACTSSNETMFKLDWFGTDSNGNIWQLLWPW